MGNLFCKQMSTPATTDLSKAIEPTGTNFLQALQSLVLLFNNIPRPSGHTGGLQFALSFAIQLSLLSSVY